MRRAFQLFFLFTGLLFCKPSLWSQDTILLAGSKLYADKLGSANSSSVVALSPEIFLVAYADRSREKGVLKLGRIYNDTVIAFQDSVDFVPFKGVEKVRLSRLSPSRFLISFILDGRIIMRGGEVLDLALIELGGVHTLKSGMAKDFSMVTFDETRFMTAYIESESGEGKCTLGSVTGDQGITIDSTYLLATGFSDTTRISIDSLSKTRFVISYGNAGGASLLATMDGTGEMAFGDPFPFATNQVLNLNVLGITERRFALVYNDNLDGVKKGAVILGSISAEAQLSYSEKLFFDDKKPSGISATKLTSYEFIISYNGGWDDWYGYVIRATVLGDTVIFSDNTPFNPEPPFNSLSPLTRLNNRDFLVTYLNRNTFKGYARVGSTNEFVDVTHVEGIPGFSFSLYPNPAGDHVNLRWEGLQGTTTIRIVDLKGRILWFRQVSSPQVTLPVGHYPRGIYLVQLSDGREVLTKKFLVQ